MSNMQQDGMYRLSSTLSTLQQAASMPKGMLCIVYILIYAMCGCHTISIMHHNVVPCTRKPLQGHVPSGQMAWPSLTWQGP